MQLLVRTFGKHKYTDYQTSSYFYIRLQKNTNILYATMYAFVDFLKALSYVLSFQEIIIK